MNNEQKFGVIAKCFHWIVALGVFTMLLLGLIGGKLIIVHKSLGVTILLLMVLRLIWRWINPQPSYPSTISATEAKLARLIHRLLYVAVFLIILVGLSMSALGGHQTYFWGWINVTLPLPLNRQLASIGVYIHLALAWCIVGLLVLHIGAALHHHFIRKNNILRRMWFTD
ncbi:MAG: cytochrome b [Pseudomonadota bacterium]